MSQNIWRPVDFENLDSQKMGQSSGEPMEQIIISDEDENSKSSISLGSGKIIFPKNSLNLPIP